MTEEAKENLRRGLWFGAYFGGVSNILRYMFTDAFSLSFSVAAGLAIFITTLGVYPIFERGTKARRGGWLFKGERSGLWDTLVWSIIFSLAVYWLARSFGW